MRRTPTSPYTSRACGRAGSCDPAHRRTRMPFFLPIASRATRAGSHRCGPSRCRTCQTVSGRPPLSYGGIPMPPFPARTLVSRPRGCSYKHYSWQNTESGSRAHRLKASKSTFRYTLVDKVLACPRISDITGRGVPCSRRCLPGYVAGNASPARIPSSGLRRPGGCIR